MVTDKVNPKDYKKEIWKNIGPVFVARTLKGKLKKWFKIKPRDVKKTVRQLIFVDKVQDLTKQTLKRQKIKKPIVRKKQILDVTFRYGFAVIDLPYNLIYQANNIFTFDRFVSYNRMLAFMKEDVKMKTGKDLNEIITEVQLIKKRIFVKLSGWDYRVETFERGPDKRIINVKIVEKIDVDLTRL